MFVYMHNPCKQTCIYIYIYAYIHINTYTKMYRVMAVLAIPMDQMRASSIILPSWGDVAWWAWCQRHWAT